jgi:hypothetical protein
MKIYKGDLFDRPDNFTGIVITSHNNEIWFLNGEAHRVDGPAFVGPHGTYWCLFGYTVTEEEHNRRTAWTRTTIGKLILSQPHFGLDSEDEGVAK